MLGVKLNKVITVPDPHMFHSFSLPRVLDQSEYTLRKTKGVPSQARPGQAMCVCAYTSALPSAILATLLPELPTLAAAAALSPVAEGWCMSRPRVHAFLPFHSCRNYFLKNEE